ncbi:MAG: transglutaminase-like domain-containing protein [Candidatus Scalindua sp.]
MSLTKRELICFEEDFFENSSEKEITIPEETPFPANLKLSNFSNSEITLKGYSINNKELYSNLQQLVSDIIDKTVSFEDQVLAIWAFLVQKAYGYPSPHPGTEAHDPIKFFHVYGYGYCDDFSTVFFAICRAVGIPARVISLGGHVVPEVEYDGKWHILDAAYATIYRDSTGVIVGVKDIENNISLLDNPEHASEPYELFGRYFSVDKLKEIYGNRNTTRDLTHYYGALSSNTHEIAIHLRPGEAINFNFKSHEAVFRSCDSPNFPPIFGNGTMKYVPFLNKQTKEYMVDSSSLSSLDESEKVVVFKNSSNKEDFFELSFISSFPLLRGWMNINLTVLRGKISIECSRDKKTRKSIWDGGPGNLSPRIIDFSGQFINFDGNRPSSQFVRFEKDHSGKTYLFQDPQTLPSYHLFMHFRLLPGTEVFLNNLEITLLFQFAPLNLPVLLGGKNNIKLNLEGKGTLTMSQIEGGDLCAY